MELALEGILETLLVGSVASLCLLTLLFLLIPNFIRVKTVHLLFRFFLYEDDEKKQASPPPGNGEPRRADLTLNDPPPTGVPAEKSEDTRSLFAGVLLCAALYGAGILAESISDRITDLSFANGPLSGVVFSDPEIRIDAFQKVGTGALVAGGASPGFEEFMTDYGACHDADLLRNSRFSSTCSTMQARAMAFYYDAKNAVYREDSYFQELSRLQTRINFTRGMGTALVFLALLLGGGGCIAALFEGAYHLRNSQMRVVRPIAAAYTAVEQTRLVQHWTHLAEGRMFLMAATSFAMGLASQVAWRDNEDEFDRRVFGYFLSIASGPRTSDRAEGGSAAPTNDGDAESYRGLPASIYQTFEVPEEYGRFEPSAIASLDGHKMLVANDKGSPDLVVFEYDERAGLTRPYSLTLEEKTVTPELLPMSRRPLLKLEALHTSKLADGYRVFTAANEQSVGVFNPHLLSFKLDESAKTVAELQQLTLKPEPCDLVVEAGNPASCVVEGLTASRPEADSAEPRDLLLGLRYVGAARQPTLTLLRYKQDGLQWNGERLWTMSLPADPETGAPNPFAGSGISALETAIDGSLLVLTSYELDEQPGYTSQVSGALWRIPAENLSSTAPEKWFADLGRPEEFRNTYLVSVFTHKPEGITMLENHSMIVVFDDDGKRKSRRHAPKTFALDQNQGAFTLIRPLRQSAL